MLNTIGKINSHNEWDKLKEIIVGTASGTTATLSWMKPGPVPEALMEEARKLSAKAFPKWFLDEVEEDLQALADTLQVLGVKVLRPTPFDQEEIYGTPFWKSNSNNAYNARDLNLVIGNTVIESPSYLASRYYETTAFYPIWYRYFENGFRWIAGPIFWHRVRIPRYHESRA